MIPSSARLLPGLILALVLGALAGPIGLISLKPATASEGGGGDPDPDPPTGGNSAILTDFSFARPTNGAGNLYPYPYNGEGNSQTATIVSGTLELVVSAGAPYLDFQSWGSSGYNFPNGVASAWLKAGETWDDDFNRMSFAVRSSAAISRPSSGGDRTQFGTYVRNPDHTSTSYQGGHPYHFFSNNFYAGVWVKHILFNAPNHVVGSSNSVNWPPNHPTPYRGRDVDHGSTSVSSWIRILAADGTTPVTAFGDLSGINFTVVRDQDEPVYRTNPVDPLETPINWSVSELGSAGAAWSSGGMFHVGSGWWRIDIPDGAWTTGVTVVSIGGSRTNQVTQGMQHRCASDVVNTSPNLATESDEARRGNYFQRLTRFYYDLQGTAASTTWHFDDLRFYQDPDATLAVTHEIRNMTIQYTGTRYEVTWEGLRNLARTYEVRYRLDGQKMRTNGFTSGTSGGTTTNPGNTYTGVLWASSNMAEDADGIYVAVRVQGETDFLEIFLPYNYGPGNDGFATQFGS